MIQLKNKSELERMKKACQISAQALVVAGENIRAGMTTLELDRILHHFIVSQGAKPSFLGYGGFPGTACISVNDEVIHGIPSSERVLREGDIVSVDMGVVFEGFVGDAARTFPVGKVSEEACKLMRVTEESLYVGIEQARAGNDVYAIGMAVQNYVEAAGFNVVRQYVGHGVGAKMHEKPEVPNYHPGGRGLTLRNGMVIAIEPMVTAGSYEVDVLEDKWTAVTRDRRLAAHFEHSVAITPDGPRILSISDRGLNRTTIGC